MSAFQPWTEPHQKADEKSRVDTALEKESEDAKNLRTWDGEIDARDRRQCRACSKRSDPEKVGLLTRGHRHHIVYRSAGGSDEPSNRVTLCASCHNNEHKHRLRFTEDGHGYDALDANAGLEFWRKAKDGGWYLSRRELAPHVVEKD